MKRYSNLLWTEADMIGPYPNPLHILEKYSLSSAVVELVVRLSAWPAIR